MSVKWAEVERGDLLNLYIVPTPHWYLNTGGNFRLSSVETNLRPGRKSSIPGLGKIEGYEKVDRLRKQLATYDAATTDEILIMIATSDVGPYTIIDGNHRAAALHLNDLSTPNMPWKGLLITGPSIASSPWDINSSSAQSNMNVWKNWADLGALT